MDIVVRKAESKDGKKVLELLISIAKLHHDGRPDIFRAGISKYGQSDFEVMLQDENRPVFVAVDESETVLGYVFCQLITYANHPVFVDYKSLYIDDFCVDSSIRGGGIGKKLFAFVKEFAKAKGCSNIDLNVWGFNESAIGFYEACGMKSQRRHMEIRLD